MRGPDLRRRSALAGFVAAVGIAGLSGIAAGQPADRVPRVGFVAAAHAAGVAARVEAFRQGLRELGYVEGKNVIVEYRYADEKLDRLPELLAGLARQPVDVIVSAGPSVTRPARDVTKSIPIVMAFDADPVASGAVASLARPGGNVTGLSILAPQLAAKQLEFMKSIVPGLKRVAVLENSREPGNAATMRATRESASALGVQLDVFDLRQPADIEAAFRAAGRGGAEAVLVIANPLVFFHRAQLAALAASHRLPTIYPFVENVEAGGLMTYSVNFNDLFRRSAAFVDRILRGRSPAELPVEQPTKFDLVINVAAAKRIGLSIPRDVIARADRVIE